MIVVLCVLLICCTPVALALILRPRLPAPALESRLLKRIVVTLKSGTTFAGVLYAEGSDALVLCNAGQVADDGSEVTADGEVIILRDTIDFIQRP